ncbi:MAG: hypothetical protein JNJ53_04295, partial [Rhizobiales bacterium]|nr:hypothetical protein [Hyphomicrobiales bacterium]
QAAAGNAAEVISARAVEASEEIDKAARSASGLVSGRLDKASRDIETTASNSSNILVGRVEKIAKDFESSASSTASAIIGRIERTSREFESATLGTGKRFDDATQKFSKHVETASTFLADQLGSTANSLDDKLESVSMQLTGRLETTGARITERLEDVSGLVEKTIDRFNVDMDRMLHSREDMLSGLVTSLGKKAQEVDSMMRNYMGMIEDSLAAAETRSKDVGRHIASQYSTIANGLEQELSKVEKTSGAQVTEITRMLREQHDRTIATMNQMLAEAATGFQQTAQDMRVTAQQVVKDVDYVRSELKRAILDLPDETRANADAMRRVVADQITALNALADVVRRNTGVLDVSGPPQHGYGARDSSPGKSEGTGSAAQPSWTAGALRDFEERTARPATPRFESLGGNAGAGTDMRRAPRDLPSAPSTAAKSVGLRDDAFGRNVPRETEALVQKLNAAARDLVEAIEGTLPADLESRYANGENHVYMLNLYENFTRRLEPSVRQRYRTERLVRGRVDSYIRLFERLLDTVSEAPRGDQLADACLASESGKLYVALAKTTGRIN